MRTAAEEQASWRLLPVNDRKAEVSCEQEKSKVAAIRRVRANV